jgi:hypothetical protein
MIRQVATADVPPARAIWAADLLPVQTLTFRTLHVLYTSLAARQLGRRSCADRAMVR